jgi:leucyl aminopeptidase
VQIPRITTTHDDIGAISCNALVVGAFEGENGATLQDSAQRLEESLGGALDESLHALGFKGRPGQVATIPTLGRLRAAVIAVAGLGAKESADRSSVRNGAAAAARKLREHSDVAIALHQAVEGSAAAATEGFLLGNYTFTTYKSEPKPSKIQSLSLLGADDADTWKGAVLANATMLARDLVNEPPGSLTPSSFAGRAEEIAEEGGLELIVFDERRLEADGFGGIVGVGRGSDEPPRLIQLRYAPENPKARLALVGKGVTFDSGGLSLKDGRGMMDMKTDMSGAAAVVGAMSALPSLAVTAEVVGYIPAVENLPSGHSIKPGDVIRHYGGRTSEVLNTDAEGRLILADALAYASEQKPDAIVDIATLTGAMVIALGTKMFGAFSTDDALIDELRAAARAAGEALWPMPLVDAYKKDLDSEIADCKNVAGRSGGSIFAALFLREFVAEGVPWSHLDIAGPARAESDFDDVSKGGTGVATRTLLHWIEGRGR